MVFNDSQIGQPGQLPADQPARIRRWSVDADAVKNQVERKNPPCRTPTTFNPNSLVLDVEKSQSRYEGNGRGDGWGAGTGRFGHWNQTT